MPFAGTKVPVLGTKVPWQKDKCLNLYFSINSVKQQLISKKTLKDKNAEVKSAICRDKSAGFRDKSAKLGTKVQWQKHKYFNLYCSIDSVEQQLILKKPQKDKNAEVKSAICRDKSAGFRDKSASIRDKSAMAERQMH